MASLAEIDAEGTAAVTALKAGDYDTALLRILCAQTLLATTPDMEMDGQRKEYRDKANHFDRLYSQVEKAKNRASTAARRIVTIPVYRSCQ